VESAGYIALTFSVVFDEETRQYTGTCIELGVGTCGDTIDETFDQITDAVDLYLNSIEEEGERPRVFAERGIQILYGEPNGYARQVTLHPSEIVSARTMRMPTSIA
jgi:predicted RNase H-like HicB family nuclease